MHLKHLSFVALTVVAGCAPGSRDVPCRPLGTTTPATPNPAFKGSVITIVMENHTHDDILGGDSPAKYIKEVAHQYAVAAGYNDPYLHPSEPNYLWMAAGENFGVTDDNNPVDNHVACTSHIADQLQQAGLPWRAYQESMGAACGLNSHYPYEPKHDPFVYFNDLNGWDGKQFNVGPRCTDHVVDYTQIDADLAAGLPKYVFITPNMINDMHDGSIQQGDLWLSHELPKLMASKAFTDGGVIFLTWDEGSSYGADDPPMIVISPLVKKGFVSQTHYTTSSYLKTVETLLGVEALPCDPQPQSVPTMDDLFTVPLTTKAG